jgi:hypothetical protein
MDHKCRPVAMSNHKSIGDTSVSCHTICILGRQGVPQFPMLCSAPAYFCCMFAHAHRIPTVLPLLTHIVFPRCCHF